MSEHFNGLTAAEAERLAMLAEEAGEIVQVVGKILRHGYESHHPDDLQGATNRDMLDKEMRDLIAVHIMMMQQDDLPEIPSVDILKLIERKHRYTHHQTANARSRSAERGRADD